MAVNAQSNELIDLVHDHMVRHTFMSYIFSTDHKMFILSFSFKSKT